MGRKSKRAKRLQQLRVRQIEMAARRREIAEQQRQQAQEAAVPVLAAAQPSAALSDVTHLQPSSAGPAVNIQQASPCSAVQVQPSTSSSLTTAFPLVRNKRGRPRKPIAQPRRESSEESDPGSIALRTSLRRQQQGQSAIPVAALASQVPPRQPSVAVAQPSVAPRQPPAVQVPVIVHHGISLSPAQIQAGTNAAFALPLPRPRGRPRKCPAEPRRATSEESNTESIASRASIHDGMSLSPAQLQAGTSSNAAFALPLPRPRGRPRKCPAEPRATSEESDGESIASRAACRRRQNAAPDSAASTSSISSATRGGLKASRARGCQVVPDPGATNHTAAGSSSVTELNQVVTGVPRNPGGRPRGRPRKRIPPRSGGRPPGRRNQQSVAAEQAELQKKRPRGRPRGPAVLGGSGVAEAATDGTEDTVHSDIEDDRRDGPDGVQSFASRPRCSRRIRKQRDQAAKQREIETRRKFVAELKSVARKRSRAIARNGLSDSDQSDSDSSDSLYVPSDDDSSSDEVSLPSPQPRLQPENPVRTPERPEELS